ncbi:MAG: hypothetical protein AB8B95_01570 [Pseudohongiellaceae bacterium]
MTLNPLVIAAVLAAAFAMIFFNYISRRKEDSEQFKARRITKLNERARKLDGIIAGLPATYLPKTLQELVYGSIIESLRQVYSLTGNENINSQIDTIRQTLSSLATKAPAQSTGLGQDNSASDPKECKHLLKDLYNLILEFHAEGLLDRNLTEAHLASVRSLLLKVSLETYKIAAKGALEAKNTGLALHYCEMAKSRLDQDIGATGLEKERAYFKDQVLKLELRVQEEESQSVIDADPNVLAEWQSIKSTEDDWKKKRY